MKETKPPSSSSPSSKTEDKQERGKREKSYRRKQTYFLKRKKKPTKKEKKEKRKNSNWDWMIDDTMARLNSPTEILAVKKIDPTKEISVTVFFFHFTTKD